MDPTAAALEGLRVIDVTQVMAGPFCAMQLGDLGADVIKVESPDGDSSRTMAGAIGTDSPSFNAVNRGKRSIVINLKTPAGVGIVKRLAQSADVLVENFRPGVMTALGLDYPALAALNPRLIYASISGYGQTGPMKAKGGFDLVAQGVSGIMSVTGEPDGAPVKSGIPLTDLGAALFATVGILAALEYRHRSGHGQHIDTSLLDAGVGLSVWEATQFFSGRGVPDRLGSAHRMSAPYQAFACADGFVTIGAANDRTFKRLCAVLGHPEWAAMPEFATDDQRTRNRADLAGRIGAITLTQPRDRWLALLDAHNVPCGPINNYEEVFRDPQVLARELIQEITHPALGSFKALGSPIKMSATPPNPRRRAPLLGEHTRAVLVEAGFDDDEIARFVEEGTAR
jgi:crotonobetainyl-CoA:carnitine CoA-transferase CaiB-like acyl-CoA transferase